MVIGQKALVGKLKKFPPGVQQLFALSRNFGKDASEIFHPFGWMDMEDIDNDQSVSHLTSNEEHGSGEIKHKPLSQTYPQWKVMCDVQKLHSLQKRKRFKNRIMYILPLGTLHEKAMIDRLVNQYQNGIPSHCATILAVVLKFLSIFFYGIEVKLLPFEDIENFGFTMRVHSKTNRKQVLVSDILQYLKKIRPSDSFCIVGWSSLDLYPCSELNFVLGEACFDNGCAVASFGYYADAAKPAGKRNYGENDFQNLTEVSCCSVDPCCPSAAELGGYPCWDCTTLSDIVVWRVLKVLTHEVCHLIGMHHCTFFACLMNESRNVSEAQNQPLFLCPVCLRKLHKFLQFSVVSRYKMLNDFMELHLHLSNGQAETNDCRDNLEHLEEIPSVNMPDDKTDKYATSTLDKFRKSLKWLDDVLKFIG